MIPKTIHYCWFGDKPLDDMAIKCIESWKKYFPDYQIVEWNETNFDVNLCEYVKQAFQFEKWAFVSDYARFWIIYHYGGIYFDTDVEIINNMENIVERGPFFGTESTERDYDEVAINPGLGMGAEPKNEMYKKVLESYHTSSFINEDGSYNYKTVVERVTEIFKLNGYKTQNTIQRIEGITIYPQEYFCPLDYNTGILSLTKNSYSIHWFNASWFDNKMSKRRETSLKIQRCINGKVGKTLSKVYLKSSYYWELISSDSINDIKRKIKNKFKSINRK